MAPPIKYDEKHYTKFAKVFKKNKGVMADIQNQYPNYSYSTLYRWVRKCRELGLIPAK